MTRARTLAAAAAAVALLGGCASTGSAGESAKAVDDAHSSATAVAPAPAPVEWLSFLDDAGIDPTKGALVSIGGMVPGAEIDQHGTCTLGPAVTNGFLTAAHCDDGDGTPVTLKATGEVLGDFSVKAFSGYQPNPADGLRPDDVTGLVLDAAVVPGVPDRQATKLAGQFPVAGVLTTAAVEHLDKNTAVCVVASQSTRPVQCGPLNRSDADGTVHALIPVEHGDSGSVAFVLTKDRRAAALIGVVSGTINAFGIAPLEPALERLDAKVLLDPDATPFTGEDFSPLVTQVS
ncbi:MAG: hypothetical protein KDB70_20095 [Mycobacterium sp.]|jgi:hypothetical protein|nr:hypothetical protein [Mycobacterium sp.]